MQSERKHKLETVVRAVVARSAGDLADQVDVRAAMSIALPEGVFGDVLRGRLTTRLREKGLNVTPVSAAGWPEESPALLVTEPKTAVLIEDDGEPEP